VIRLAFFGAACVAAIIVASFAREGRQCLLVASAVVAINWLLFASYWIYQPASPAFVVWGIADRLGFDLPVKHEDMWALADLASLMVTAWWCRPYWWSPLLWSMYLACLCVHAVAWVNGLEYLDYRYALDGALVVQLAVLFLIGGDGCADSVSDLCRRVRDVVRTASGNLQSFSRSSR